ncbi:MAG: hypothetical protein ACI9C1_000477 [Candidatus Aldehydirespiratoraceae bacterium]|jgi:hypothetical protein
MSAPVFDNAIFANSYVTVAAQTPITGDILAGGYLTIGANSPIVGDTVAVAATTLGESVELTGNVRSGAATTLGANATVSGNIESGAATVFGAGASSGSTSTGTTAPDVSVAQQAVSDARGALALMAPDEVLTPGNIAADVTYTAGVHKVTGFLTVAAGVTITLDAENQDGAEFVFNVSDYLVFGANAKVVIVNGTANTRVVWNASTYITLGAGAEVIGSMLSNGYVKFGANAELTGVGDSCGGAVYSATSYVSVGMTAAIGSDLETCVDPNTPPVDPPLECTAVVVDGAKALITWSSVAGGDRYVVYRNGYWLFASNTALTYTDTNPPTGTQVEYEVRSHTDGHKDDFVLCEPALEFDAPPPLECTLQLVGDGTQVQLDWNSIAGATKYVISRDSKWLAATTATTHTDANPPKGTPLEYFGRSIIGGVRSPWVSCGEVEFDTQPPLECTLQIVGDGTQVQLDWNSITGATKYVISRDSKWLAATTATTHTDANPPKGTPLEYFARSIAGGLRSPWVSCGEVEFDAPALECTLQIVGDGTQVQLDWNSVAGATKYAVSRSGVFLDRTTATTHTDANPPADTLLKYFVRSISASERSPWVSCGNATLDSTT